MAWPLLVSNSLGQLGPGSFNCRERAHSNNPSRGATWSYRQIICHCDNQVVVAWLTSRTSKCKGVMHLLCCLLFEAHQRCYLHPTYIDTHANYLVDTFSRNNLPSFSLSIQVRTLTRPPYLFLFWTSSWIPQQIGHLHVGAICSTLLQNGLAPSTQKTYQAALKRFHNFCIQYNVLQPFLLAIQANSMYFRSLLGRPGFNSPDREILSLSPTQHANFSRTS